MAQAAGIGSRHEAGIDQRQQRQHAETGDGQQRIEIAQRPCLHRQQADFLACLAQGGGGGTGVFRFDPATRETHLPGVVAQAVVTAREQHGRRLGMRHHAHQHRCLARFAGRQQAVEFVHVPRRAARRCIQRVGGPLQARGQCRIQHQVRSRCAARRGSTSSIMRRRTSSFIIGQAAISSPVLWQPAHRPSSSMVQTPMQGLSTARKAVFIEFRVRHAAARPRRKKKPRRRGRRSLVASLAKATALRAIAPTKVTGLLAALAPAGPAFGRSARCALVPLSRG